MTIQTSADGVRTEQQSMEHLFRSRSVMLSEHLANMSRHVARITQSGEPSSIRTRTERLQLETEEVQVLRARLECTEHNLRDLAKVAEYEHGAAYYSYAENQARGFGQEEMQAARDHGVGQRP
eukprot:2526985-Amphidinium_carterae.1